MGIAGAREKMHGTLTKWRESNIKWIRLRVHEDGSTWPNSFYTRSMLFVGPRQSSLYLDTTCKQFFEISNASNPLSSLVSPLINKN